MSLKACPEPDLSTGVNEAKPNVTPVDAGHFSKCPVNRSSSTQCVEMRSESRKERNTKGTLKKSSFGWCPEPDLNWHWG